MSRRELMIQEGGDIFPLRNSGFILSHDGTLLDNRDSFFDEHPDFSRTYDSRTYIAITCSEYVALIREVETLRKQVAELTT